MLCEEVMTLERWKFLEVEYDYRLPLVPSAEVHSICITLTVAGVIDLCNVAEEWNLLALVITVVDDEPAIVDRLLNEGAEFGVLTVTCSNGASTHLDSWIVFVHFVLGFVVYDLEESPPDNGRGTVVV